MNLLVNEIEDIAEAVKLRAMARGPVRLFVGPAGQVAMHQADARRRVSLPDTCIVGTYSRAMPTEEIEEDLTLRLHELRPRRAA